MDNPLCFLRIAEFKTEGGVLVKELNLSYQLFGQKIGSAPVVVVNHALTGNSDVASKEKGWWKTIIQKGKLIDTNRYSVIAFNIPGNGFDKLPVDDYRLFSVRDIATLFIKGLNDLGIRKIHAVIGGSLGGGIAWEMAVQNPKRFNYVIPIAANWRSTDWIIGHNHVQNSLLENSKHPLKDARMMAMLFYRTPVSFENKFNRSKNETDKFNVCEWLDHHGERLENRYQVESYQRMNYILATIDITDRRQGFPEVAQKIEGTIIQIGINSDLFFSAEENIKAKILLDQENVKNEVFIIDSIHGHDAFLIEYEQLTKILTPYL